MTEKNCTKCGVEKVLSEFYKDTRRKSGASSWCRECWKSYEAARREKLGVRGRKERKLKYLYGMSINEYTSLLKLQNNVCAVCGGKETVINNKSAKLQKLSVDHDHKTGKIRGLLCTACNKGLGLLNDDFNILLKAYDYLFKYREENNDTGTTESNGGDSAISGSTQGA